ncbi:MAG: GUN4 domain-containing protein [Okeania sp. SIO2F4]|uniref:GUN4 domain-containing protein n=1 Tax=Okeania sp. SIO2F4 TaxID=2607790 RepID=UPI00142BC3C4|nr:GUN4 domain-containing protein [Okeania sp. SIO2F4]NES03580.1 GUN4 domain-containing protein [Okeania sp. SIO2F4]
MLMSDVGYNYTQLETLLSEKKWKEADRETARCMLQVAGLENEGYLTKEDIENFLCADLGRIDQLWLQYSNDQFGFSVQKEIYQNLGGTTEYNQEVYEAFNNKVGWSQEGQFLLYPDLDFSSDEHYRGYLPGCVLKLDVWYVRLGWLSDGVFYRGWDLVSSLSERLVECKIQRFPLL